MIYEFDTVTKVFTLKSSATWNELVEAVNNATKGLRTEDITVRFDVGTPGFQCPYIEPSPVWVYTPGIVSFSPEHEDIVSDDGEPGVRVRYSASADVVVGKDDSGKYVGGIDPVHNAMESLSTAFQEELTDEKYSTDFSITKEKTTDITRYEGAMSFSRAQEAMKDGKKVYRRGGSGDVESLRTPLSLEPDEILPERERWSAKPVFYFHDGGNKVKRSVAFSIEDILANDWFLVRPK